MAVLECGAQAFVKAMPGRAVFAGDYRFEAVVSAALPEPARRPRLAAFTLGQRNTV
ncbi:hypothetical protein [Nonomuraea turkmeniaca]|uniref:hypothetical protein n=1 Tax=Nonomuraea turkmeniaca TaxID=103838 RepID=UPI001476F375|nr:hypothetical protein [Nonomuraea turkmeniaca]